MGYGDELIGSGLARGAAARGKRVAFGDGQKIVWHRFAHEIYRGNPNVAPPGSESDPDLEWIAHYSGHRIYNQGSGDRWLWRPGQMRGPGEIFLTNEEVAEAKRYSRGFVIVEPNAASFKKNSPNRTWSRDRWDRVVRLLIRDGVRVAQFSYDPPWGPGHVIPGAKQIRARTFRTALAVMARARMYLGTEGGLAHGAAAVGTDAVVVWGGFVSPAITGYDSHVNIYEGGEPCGSLRPCDHCRRALDAISIERVLEAARERLS